MLFPPSSSNELGESLGEENSPSVQFSSVTRSCLTLCDPMNRSMVGLPVYHQLLEFTWTHVYRVALLFKLTQRGFHLFCHLSMLFLHLCKGSPHFFILAKSVFLCYFCRQASWVFFFNTIFLYFLGYHGLNCIVNDMVWRSVCLCIWLTFPFPLLSSFSIDLFNTYFEYCILRC